MSSQKEVLHGIPGNVVRVWCRRVLKKSKRGSRGWTRIVPSPYYPPCRQLVSAVGQAIGVSQDKSAVGRAHRNRVLIGSIRVPPRYPRLLLTILVLDRSWAEVSVFSEIPKSPEEPKKKTRISRTKRMNAD